jgi:hypothetical protein
MSARASVRRRFMPPDSVRIPTSRLVDRPCELEELRYARFEQIARQSEVAAVDQEVLADGEIRVEVVHLRHDADADARFAAILRHRLADHRDVAAVRLDEAEAAAQRRRLARAVGAEQAEAIAPLDGEREPAHDLVVAVALAQAVDLQDHVVRAAATVPVDCVRVSSGITRPTCR